MSICQTVKGVVLPDNTMNAMDGKTLPTAPALRPPPGTISDFVNPYSTTKVFIPASAVCVFFLCTTISGLIPDKKKNDLEKVKGLG